MSGLEILLALVIAVGLAGILFPVLPGSVLILAAIGVWSFDTGGVAAWVVFAVAAAFLVAGNVVKYTIPGKRMRSSGVPRTTLLVGALCAVAGFFVIPVVGLVVGFVLGVYLAELNRVGKGAAWPSTVAAIKAVGISILIELAAALAAVVAWVVGLVVT
ncbi:MAG: DUF456 domain-containing protein [Nocardioides sp.]